MNKKNEIEKIPKTKKPQKKEIIYSKDDALIKFEELKQIALNCLDKNGNPNIAAAIRAEENKAKIAGHYLNNNYEISTVVKMSEITIDGQQLKLNVGEEFI